MKTQYLFILIALFSLNITIGQEVLESKYYFVNGGKLFSLEQHDDILYEYRCNANFDCKTKARKHFKIIRTKQNGKQTLLEIERLDSIPLTINPIRDDRFKFLGIERISKGKIKVINEAKGYTKDSISKIPFEISFLKNKFGYTYYEESYLKSLNKDYVIDSAFAMEIMESIKSTNVELIKDYKNTVTGDMYLSGLTAELIAREMTRRNLSPILAKNRISKLNRK